MTGAAGGWSWATASASFCNCWFVAAVVRSRASVTWRCRVATSAVDGSGPVSFTPLTPVRRPGLSSLMSAV